VVSLARRLDSSAEKFSFLPDRLFSHSRLKRRFIRFLLRELGIENTKSSPGIRSFSHTATDRDKRIEEAMNNGRTFSKGLCDNTGPSGMRSLV
jgi:hypothetical protein